MEIYQEIYLDFFSTSNYLVVTSFVYSLEDTDFRWKPICYLIKFQGFIISKCNSNNKAVLNNGI